MAEGRLTRASLVRGGAALAAGGAALAVWPRTTVSAPSAKQDAEILRFALTVEDLQAAFYVDAVKQGALSGELLEYAQTVGGHERDHAALIRKLLGASAPKPPTFAFGDTNTTPTLRRRRDRARGPRRGLQRSGPNLTPGAGRRRADRLRRGPPCRRGSATSSASPRAARRRQGDHGERGAGRHRRERDS